MRTSKSLTWIQNWASTLTNSAVAHFRFSFRRAFTLLEILIVAGILAMVIGVGLMSFRETSTSSTAVTKNLAMSMDLRQAADKLTETFIEGSEVLSPSFGSSKGFVVILDLFNYSRILYLEAEPEKPGNKYGKTYALISYTDTYEGKFNPKRKQRLFGKIRRLTFTPVTPGLVQAHLTLVNDAGKELGTLIELSLKNVSSVYD